jgi:hypothetical protein
MPIFSVYETFENRSAKVATNRLREYTRTFNVVTTQRVDDGVAVRLAPGLPVPWSPYVAANGLADLGSWCKEVRVRQDAQDPYLWRVEARYSSQVDRPDINQVESPLLRPADISWDTVSYPRVAVADRDGGAIVNVNDERFDPPLMRDEKRLQLTVTRNQAGYDALSYALFENCTNSNTFLGFPAGRARCTRVKGDRQFENGVLFWRALFQFQFRILLDEVDEDVSDEDKSLRAWAEKVLNQGFYVMEGGQRVHARDPRGQPSPTPVLLAADGARLAPGAEPYYLNFHLYPSRDFSLLGLF